MSYREARRWADYIAKHGSLNPARHIERGFAMLSHFYCLKNDIKVGGKIPSMNNLMPHHIEPPITLAAAMKAWS